ncbi:MAG: hypothetical protein ACM3SS_24910 [Rhodospirillaceae bacterium]
MRTPLIATITAAVLAGCLTYSPRDYTAMSAYDLCELEHYQRVNLTAQSRTALEAELKRRNESCKGVLPRIERDRADDVYDRMYNRQSP